MGKINLRSVASLLDGFNSTYDTIGRVMRDRDLREISRSKLGEQVVGFDMPAGDQPEGSGGQMPTPRKQYTFLGQTFDTAPDEGQMSRARQLAMAGVLEKHGQPERGMNLRNNVMAAEGAAEDRAHQRRVRPLQVAGLERAERTGAAAEQDAGQLRAVDADVSQWFQGRLTGPDGAQRAPTADDHLAARMYRVTALTNAGRLPEAGQAMQEYQAAAFGKIQMETAERTEAARKAAMGVRAGDFSGVVELYNRFLPDGATLTEVRKRPDGKVELIREVDGRPMKPEVTTLDDLMVGIEASVDPSKAWSMSMQLFNQQLQLRADGRAAAAEGRAAETHRAGASGRRAAELSGAHQATLLDPAAPTPAKADAVKALEWHRAGTAPPGRPEAAKVDSGDVVSLLGDPAARPDGSVIYDPMTGRQAVNRNVDREREFFEFMSAAGIRDTNEGLLQFRSMPEFPSEAEAAAAARSGRLRKGQWVRVGGQVGQWQ
jgi:hypothetical protein